MQIEKVCFLACHGCLRTGALHFGLKESDAVLHQVVSRYRVAGKEKGAETFRIVEDDSEYVFTQRLQSEAETIKHSAIPHQKRYTHFVHACDILRWKLLTSRV